MSLSEQQDRSGVHRRRADRGHHGYGAVDTEAFAPSLLTPRGPRPWLPEGWAWATLGMAVLGCVANRASDRDIDSALAPLQPTVSLLACVTAVVGVVIVWRAARVQRAVLARDSAEVDEFFRQRTTVLELQPPSQLTRFDAESRVAQTRDERKEVTVMARQVNTVMFVIGLVVVLSTSAVLSMAWSMREPLPVVLSWANAIVMIALLLAVLPTFDRRYTLNLAAAWAVRRNDAEVRSWMATGRPVGAPQPRASLTQFLREVRSPGTALALVWLLALTITLIVRSL